jgi:endonuclease/exonuclease/phosphatase family metal-dependent hydrolase
LVTRKVFCVCAVLLFFTVQIFLHAPAGKAESSMPSPVSVTRLRVMSWNIQFGDGTDAVKNYDRTAKWIASVNADLVGLCEVPSGSVSLIKTLVTQKTGRTWYSHFVPKYSGTDEGNLILSQHALAATGSKFLSANRSVAQATVNVGGQNINFFATHFDHESSSNRVTEAAQLKSWAAGFSEPRIITGDFNAGPDTPEALALTNSYYDAWSEAMKRGTASAYSDNPVGMHTRTRRGRIDYVFYSRSSSVLTATAARIPDSRDLNNSNVVIRLGTLDDKGVRPSDHNFVVAEFDVNGSAPTPAPAPTPIPTPTPTPTPTPAVPPLLLIDPTTGRGLALHSALFTRDPFKITSPLNPGSDKRTRVILFGLNIKLFSGETASAVSAKAVSSFGGVYDLPVEYVGRVPGYEWLSHVTLRLPQDPTLKGNISVSIGLHGTTSNSVTLQIAPP